MVWEHKHDLVYQGGGEKAQVSTGVVVEKLY